MKTIIMAIPYGTDARNLLRTDVLKTLKSSGVRIIILSPAFNEDYFVQEFADDNTVVEKLFTQRQNILHRASEMTRLLWLADPEFSDTIRIKNNRLKSESAFVRLRLAISYPLATSKKVRDFLRWADMRFLPESFYKEIFAKYNPSLVFVAYPFLAPTFPVLRRAKQNRIPSVIFVSSWDNLSNRGELPVKSDKIIVWNEINKREAIELQGYSPSDVFISGVPQFDPYFSREELSSREEFFREIGADMDKKLLVYTTAGTHISSADPEIVDIINEYIEDGRFSSPCRLLVRAHPRAPFELYQRFENCQNIILERPGRLSNAYSDNWDPTRRDLIHLANMMMHADVSINIASTITIEACIFDTPVVNIGFDGHQNNPYLNSAIRYYDYTHYRNIVKAGGVKVAKNKEELLEYINMYLETPRLDSDGRKRIVEEQCFYTDGKSGERVANYILECLEKGK